MLLVTQRARRRGTAQRHVAPCATCRRGGGGHAAQPPAPSAARPRARAALGPRALRGAAQRCAPRRAPCARAASSLRSDAARVPAAHARPPRAAPSRQRAPAATQGPARGAVGAQRCDAAREGQIHDSRRVARPSQPRRRRASTRSERLRAGLPPQLTRPAVTCRRRRRQRASCLHHVHDATRALSPPLPGERRDARGPSSVSHDFCRPCTPPPRCPARRPPVLELNVLAARARPASWRTGAHHACAPRPRAPDPQLVRARPPAAAPARCSSSSPCQQRRRPRATWEAASR